MKKRKQGKKCFIHIIQRCPRILKVVILIGLVGLPLYSNYKYPFPHFLFFYVIFILIGVSVSYFICFFNKKINHIIALTVKEPPCKTARVKIQKNQNCRINKIIPTAVVITFGVGGCIIFSNLEVTPTFLCCILVFIPIVYMSILGYLKYVYLCIFIYMIAVSPKQYKELPKIRSSQIPPDINWHRDLRNLFFVYQGAFFLLGLMYIIAFSKFCFSSEYGVYHNSIIFYSLWGIIFLFVVVAFPVMVLLGIQWMKQIDKNIAEYYFVEFKKEKFIFEQEYKPSEIFADIIRRTIIKDILSIKENKVHTMIFKGYSAIMTIVNLVISLITVLDFFNISLGVLF